MNPILPLHKALLSALDNLVVNSVSVPVFDAVQEGQSFPYITLDSHQSRELNALKERRDLRFVFFNIWSTQRGQEQVLRIMAAMAEKLDGVRMTLDSGSVVDCRVEDMQTRRDADNVTFSGTLIVRIITKH